MIALGMELDPVENATCFPKQVSPDAEVRAAAKEAEQELAAFSVESSMRKDVYAVLKAVAATCGGGGGGGGLSAEEQRFMAKSLVAYEQNGMHLGPEAMKEVEALKKQLSALEVAFSSNIAEDDTTHLASAAELAGCSADFLSSLDKASDGSGRLVLTMAYPHIAAVNKNCKVENSNT